MALKLAQRLSKLRPRISPTTYWTMVELIGLSMLGGGIWHHWCSDFAFIFWGLVLTVAATLHSRKLEVDDDTDR